MSELISRQAAIDYFVTNVGFNDEDGYPIEDECELRRIWTDIIEGIPPEPDAISRQAAIKDAETWVAVDEYEKHLQKKVVEWLKEFPPAQPQRTGKWIKITKGAMHEKYMCSACGRTIEEDGIERLVPIKYPFCHCGAKMEGAANND